MNNCRKNLILAAGIINLVMYFLSITVFIFFLSNLDLNYQVVENFIRQYILVNNTGLEIQNYINFLLIYMFAASLVNCAFGIILIRYSTFSYFKFVLSKKSFAILVFSSIVTCYLIIPEILLIIALYFRPTKEEQEEMNQLRNLFSLCQINNAHSENILFETTNNIMKLKLKLRKKTISLTEYEEELKDIINKTTII